MNAFRSLLTGSFARFLLVGVLNTLVGLSASFALYNLAHFNYWASTFVGNAIGSVVSYFLNRAFTFRSKASFGSSWWRFALVILICYGFSYGFSYVLAEAAASHFPSIQSGWLHNAAILVGNGLYTIGNYAGHKYFTFRTHDSKKDRAS
ncbi:hypothetical protein A8709_04470 [Paenibacillus pectinilyticus]|uniref:GtrA/DPMS transmembrane domain-containing protein n=1 Tax=Paenibacillus pectinilyticus TaxID=512399 RepID=A0A1C0ZSG3_9BACL|nr:GtrA family protein [Paenibacillus pectinilyticus]OCT10963.1 hypothetical protein A8709_04470 [Paenibacillus pectinilyticus]